MFHQEILTIVIFKGQSSSKTSNSDFGEKVAGKFLNLDFNGQSFSKNSNRAFSGLVAGKFFKFYF